MLEHRERERRQYEVDRQIERIQQALDVADPFWVEALNDKTDEELIEMIERMEIERMVIEASNSTPWLERHRASLDLVQKMYTLRLLRRDGVLDPGHVIG